MINYVFNAIVVTKEKKLCARMFVRKGLKIEILFSLNSVGGIDASVISKPG